MKPYLKLARIHHYIKNFFIVLPLFFGGQLFNAALGLKCIYGFAAFCLISSVVYIINDIRDVAKDRRHETKCKRPIACGDVSVKSAVFYGIVLFVVSGALNVAACGTNFQGYFFIYAYFILNIFYSCGGKNIPILDVAVLATGFLLRLLYGASIVGINISNWLYLTVLAMSFYFALGKRRNELDSQSGETRVVLKYYNYAFLDKMMYMFMAIGIVFYSLWCVDALTLARFPNGNLVWSVPIVILICMRYSLIVEGNSDGDPVEVLVHDKPILFLLLAYVIALTALMYI